MNLFFFVRKQHTFSALLTLTLLTTTIVAPPSNASKWQIGFNSAFKGLSVITWTIRARDARRITAAEMKYMRITAG